MVLSVSTLMAPPSAAGAPVMFKPVPAEVVSPMVELASLLLAIEPASMALVTPPVGCRW
jgi:hypothetical protein